MFLFVTHACDCHLHLSLLGVGDNSHFCLSLFSFVSKDLIFISVFSNFDRTLEFLINTCRVSEQCVVVDALSRIARHNGKLK
jgi:hypothetical protein